MLTLIHLSGSDKAAAATWLRGAMWQVWESRPMEIKQQQLNANKGRDKTLSWGWWMPWWQRSGRARSPQWPLLWAFSSAHRCERSVIATKCQVTCRIPVLCPFFFFYNLYWKHPGRHAGAVMTVCLIKELFDFFCKAKHAWPCMLCLEHVQSGALFIYRCIILFFFFFLYN